MLKRTCVPFYSKKASRLERAGADALRRGNREMAAVLMAQADRETARRRAAARRV